MNLRSIATGQLMLTLAMVAAPVIARAQTGTDSCLQATYDLMAREERMYRSVLFGQKLSEDLPEGSVRYDGEDDSTWLKTGTNSWKSLDEGYDGNTRSDRLMDDRADVKERRGIFEMRSASTSELIPPILQSMRALQCRLKAVCLLAEKSQEELPEDETVTVQPDGCIEFEFEPVTECRTNTIAEIADGSCMEAAEGVIDRESKLLQTVIAYDAAYRTLSQFAGIFEGFLTDFRFPLIEPIWQMVRALGSLDNMPCFNGQCDE